MIRGHKFLACTMSSLLGLCSTAIDANAACPLAGNWHFFALEAGSPGIATTTESVSTGGPPGSINIETFSFNNSNPGYTNSIASVINCTLAVQGNGSFSGAPCTSYGVTNGAQSTTVSGQLSESSCNFTGTITIPNDTAVSIVSGYINGNSGSGIATQGSSQVLYFTLMKSGSNFPIAP